MATAPRTPTNRPPCTAWTRPAPAELEVVAVAELVAVASVDDGFSAVVGVADDLWLVAFAVALKEWT